MADTIRLRVLPSLLPQEVEFRQNDADLEYRYVGTDTWIALGQFGATLEIGTVSTLGPNEIATVENVGTPQHAVLNIGIPAGSDGLVQAVVEGNGIAINITDPNNPIVAVTIPPFATLALASANNPAVAPVAIQTAGYAAAGDGGGATYKKVVSEPSHAGKFQDAAGNWYELAEAAPNVIMFGADKSGGSNSAAAFTAAEAFGTDVRVPRGTYKFSADTTYTGKRWHFEQGAMLSVDSGKTLTIYAEIEAGEHQIFGGAGAVIGIRSVLPEWFGAVGDNVADDLAAFNKAMNSVGNSYSGRGVEQIIRLSARSYYLSGPWNLYPTVHCNLIVRGSGPVLGGTRLRFATNQHGVWVRGNANPITAICNFKLQDFGVVCNAASSGSALLFCAESGKSIGGLQMSLVENVYSEFFSGGILVANARLIKFSRCSVWHETVNGAIGVQIASNTSFGSAFTGDLTFEGCQFVEGLALNSKSVLVASDGASAGIAGVRFTECIFYHATYGVALLAQAGGDIGDTWFTRCQFDGTGRGSDIYSTGAGSAIIAPKFEGNYFQGCNNKGVVSQAVSSGFVKDIMLNANWMNGINASAVEIADAANILMVGNILNAINTANPAVTFYNVDGGVFSGNRHAAAKSYAGGPAGAQAAYTFSISGNTKNVAAVGNSGYGGWSAAFFLNTSTGLNNVVDHNT